MNTAQNNTNFLGPILVLGEGQFIEFKTNVDKSFQKELVAFANASGGTIYIDVDDAGKIKGISVTNILKSQIHDFTRNCDPPIPIDLIEYDNVLAVKVKEGVNKPYACSTGFYLRMGANAQKMKRDEVLVLAVKTGKIRYDEQICTHFDWKDFDEDKFSYYLKLSKVSHNLSREEILRNIRVLTHDGMTNAGVLFSLKILTNM